MAEALVGSIGPLNPLFAQEDNSRDIGRLIYQGLTAIDASQEVVPALAAGWKVSDDHLSYTVDVRPDVRWADGRALTAEDVLFTFRVLQDPEYKEPGASYWRQIKVEGSGPNQVRFTLKAPSAPFLASLAVGIIPRHVFGGLAPSQIAASPKSSAQAFGTGPFQVESISRDGKVVTLARNPYASPAPLLDHFIFRAYPSPSEALGALLDGQVDGAGGLLPPQLAALARRPDIQLQEMRTYGYTALIFNLGAEGGFFASASVRQALVQAVDRRQLIDDVLMRRADSAPGPIPPTDWAYEPGLGQRYPYDPKAAEKALEAAGWMLGSDGRRTKGQTAFSVSLTVADAYPYRQEAEILSRQLREVGVEVKVDPVPASILVGRYLVGRRYQMVLAAFDNGPDPDPYALWHSGAEKDAINFAGLPRQGLIDKDLEDGRAALDRKTRREAYSDFQELILDAAPAVFLYEPHYLYAVTKRVRGVRMDAVAEPGDRYAYVTAWYVQTRAAS